MHKFMYKVWTTSFNTMVYEGFDLKAAMASAERTGFECTVSHPRGMMCWSPIGGWRTLYRHETYNTIEEGV